MTKSRILDLYQRVRNAPRDRVKRVLQNLVLPIMNWCSRSQMALQILAVITHQMNSQD